MTTEVFKELKDFSVCELEEVISLAKEELTKRRTAQRVKLQADFMAIYNTLTEEGIEIHYISAEDDILLNRGDCFYFN